MLLNAYRVFVGIPEGKIPFGCHRHGWEVNIKMNLKELGWEGIDWIYLTQDSAKWQAVISTIINLYVP